MTLIDRPRTAVAGETVDDLRGDAAAHGIPPRAARWLAAFPLVGGFVVLLTFAYRPLFVWILREDHPIEWLQFTLDLVTSIVAAMAAVGFARRRQWLNALTFLALALGAFALAGEEISWGQRAFDFTTPGELAQDNNQGEFNLHNLDGRHGSLDISMALRLVEMVIGIGGASLPLLTRLRRSPLRRVAYLRTLSPPVFLIPAFTMAFAVRAADLALRAVNHVPGAVVFYLEWAELCLDVGLAGMAICARTPMLARRRGRHCSVGPDGLPVPRSPLTPAVLGVIAACLLLTLVLAIMTMESGMLPGNVEG